MGQLEKLYQRILADPRQVRFAELDRVLRRVGFERKQPTGGSSHYVYRKGSYRLVVPFRTPHVKAIYVKRAIEAVSEVLRDE